VRRLPDRWLIVGLFSLYSVLNYLDRQLLPALAPAVQAEFQLSHASYGWLLTAFSLTYAAAAPFGGWLVDRLGLRRGAALLLAAWSAGTLWTGLAASVVTLAASRTLLGLAQAGGVPASGKAVAMYLPPHERALGTAVTQIGLSVGAILAPLVGAWSLSVGNWRASFWVAGLAGLGWILLWWRAGARPAGGSTGSSAGSRSARTLLRDGRIWFLAAANVLHMSLYSLWSNWTTVFLVEHAGLNVAEANARFAWFPPLCANAGGLFGGWLAYRWIRSGMPVGRARYRVCWLSAALASVTALVPWAPSPAFATALIGASYFWVTSMSVNVYALAMDLFAPEQAGLAVAMLTSSYGWMQAGLSPLVGRAVDTSGFELVCGLMAFWPMLGAVLVWLAVAPGLGKVER